MKRILTSIHGQSFGLSDDQRAMASNGTITGLWGRQMNNYPDPLRFSQFDDFLGPTMSTQWATEKGSDGGTALFAINAAQNGTARGVTGAGTGTMAIDGVQISGSLNYAASAGGLEVAARVKMSAVASIAIFVGFTNESGTLQCPANGSGTGNGITYNANDCCGFLYDSAMTTEDWWLVGNAATVAATAQDTGGGPTLAVYDDLYVHISSTGVATFFRNGVQAGSTQMSGAITAATVITPVVAAFSRSAASVNVDLDYLYASCKRV